MTAISPLETSAQPLEWSRVRGVVFDLVDTLMRPVPAAAEAYRLAGQQFGHNLSAEEAAVRFRKAFARQEKLDREQHGLRTSPDRERARWAEIVAEVFPAAEPSEQLFESLWRHFALSEHWRAFSDVGPALAALGGLGLRLAIGSNFDERLHGVVRGCADLQVIGADAVFDSAALGWRKPARPFFEAIEARLGLPPTALLMVGDDAYNDLAGAQSAGWQAYLVGSGRGEDGEAAGLGELVEALTADLT
jgi:putative hydrolase of the HAD superfamily